MRFIDKLKQTFDLSPKMVDEKSFAEQTELQTTIRNLGGWATDPGGLKYYSGNAYLQMRTSPTLEIKMYDGSKNVFHVIGSGTNVGDVIIGDYTNSKGLKWDDSAGTFTVRGILNADDITGGTLTGRTVRTAASGARVQLDSANYLQCYDASRLRIKMNTDELKFYDGNGIENLTLKGDTTYGSYIHSLVNFYIVTTTPNKTIMFADMYNDMLTIGSTVGGIRVGVNMAPDTTNTYDFGSATKKWNYVYRTNESACNLPTSNSAIDTIKKIKTPKIDKGEYGERHYFKDKDFPKEMKCTHKGKTEIEFTRTTGVLVQAVRELIEEVEKLKVEINK